MCKCRKCKGTRMANSGEDEMTMEDYDVILVSLEKVLSFETDGDFIARVRTVYRKMVKVMEEYI